MVYKPTFTSLRGAQAAFRRQGGGDWWLQVRKMQLQVAFFPYIVIFVLILVLRMVVSNG